jgi:hypothetical protein
LKTSTDLDDEEDDDEFSDEDQERHTRYGDDAIVSVIDEGSQQEGLSNT